MKTLEERIADFIDSQLEDTGVYWRKDIIAGVQALITDAAHTPNGSSDNPLVAEMESRCSDMLLVSQAVETCADVFKQACTPRPPKAEWFEKWPHWNLCYGQGSVWTSAYFVEVLAVVDDESDEGDGYTALRRQSLNLLDEYLDFDMIIECWPISDSGTPVGWQVVGE